MQQFYMKNMKLFCGLKPLRTVVKKRGCSKIKCYGPLFMEFSKMKKAANALQI